MLCKIRKRKEPEDTAYSLYLYFLGLSLPLNTSKAVSRSYCNQRLDSKIQTRDVKFQKDR